MLEMTDAEYFKQYGIPFATSTPDTEKNGESYGKEDGRFPNDQGEKPF